MNSTMATVGRVLPRPPYAAALLLTATLGLLLAGVLAPRPPVELAVEDALAPRAMVRFYGLEQNATDTYRWSEPLAGVFLYGHDGRPALVTLRLAAPRPDGEAPAQLTARTGDLALGSFAVSNAWRRYHLLTPTRPAGETALLLETAPFLPAGDPRALGVAISDLRIETAGLERGVPPLRSLFLLSLPLLAWLLLLRLGTSPWLALMGGGLLAAVAGWAAAFPVASGYWLPTLGWPWWPLLPLALLLAWPQLRAGLGAAQTWAAARPTAPWLGVGVALTALLGMRMGLPWPVGMGLLVAGVYVASSSLARAEDRSQAEPVALAAFGLLGVLAVALLLRLWNLDGQPAGLWRDESRHGLQALRIWENPSYRPVYVVEGADLPALLFYLMAPVLGLFGPHAWSARLVSALAGALMPLALFWAAAPMLGRRPALIAAALLAWASWSLSMSRWAFPATLDHLLVLVAVGLLWRGLDPAPARYGVLRVVHCACAGCFGGLAMYAYHTGRVAPLALGAVALVRLGWSLPAWRRAAPGLLVAMAAGALTVAPLAAAILGDPDGFNRRVGSVSILDSNNPEVHTPIGLIWGNLSHYLLMFHVAGDTNGRHHMPEAPMLDPLAGLGLALGLAVALRHASQQPGLAAALALGVVYLIPGVFSGNAPHAMRSLGTLAPALMLAGVGLAALVGGSGGHVSGRWPTVGARRWLIGAALALSCAFNLWLYFGVMRVEPEVYGEFDLIETAMARVAAAPATSANPALQAVQVYMPAELLEEDTVQFLTWRRRANSFDGTPLPPDGDALVLLPPGVSTAEREAALAALGPGGALLDVQAFFPGTQQPLLLAYGRGAGAQALLAEALR